MESTIARLRRRAMQHSRQAARLWKRSKELLNSTDTEFPGTAVRSALELNERAVAECKKALNTIDFLRRYHEPQPLRGENTLPENGEH